MNVSLKKIEIQILETLFAAEINPNQKIAPQINSKSKKTKLALSNLVSQGMIEACESFHADSLGSFKMTGWMLTFSGHMAYCFWAASQLDDMEEK
jgi:hypothetical protein